MHELLIFIKFKECVYSRPHFAKYCRLIIFLIFKPHREKDFFLLFYVVHISEIIIIYADTQHFYSHHERQHCWKFHSNYGLMIFIKNIY